MQNKKHLNRIFFTSMMIAFCTQITVAAPFILKKDEEKQSSAEIFSKAQVLNNGSRLLLETDNSVVRQIVRLQFETGTVGFTQKEKATAQVLLRLLSYGEKGMTREQNQKRKFLQNASLNTNLGPQNFSITLGVLPEFLNEALRDVHRLMRNINDDDLIFDEVYRDYRLDVRRAFDSMPYALEYFENNTVFKSDDVINAGLVSPNEIEGIKAQDLSKILKKFLNFSRLKVYSIGPLKEKEIISLLNREFSAEFKLSKYKPTPFKRAKLKDLLSTKKKVFFVSRSGVVNNQVRILNPLKASEQAKERAIAYLSQSLLGEGLTGRLGKELREKRGLTYSATSSLYFDDGLWEISSYADNSHIQELLSGLFEVTRSFSKEKIDNIELSELKNRKVEDFLSSFELPMDRITYEEANRRKGIKVDLYKKYPQWLKSTTAKEIEQFTRAKMSLSRPVLFVLGDPLIILPVLKNLGYLEKEIEVISFESAL